MAVAVWSRRFETGIQLIDAQHQALFTAVNRMAESFGDGLSHRQAAESLDFLDTYIREHFQTEERFMRDMGYPALEAHLVEHAHLAGQVRDLQARQAGGATITMGVVILLADWLKDHIEEADMGYARFLRRDARP